MAQTVRAVAERGGRNGVVVNHAGYLESGGMEEAGALEAQSQFETNGLTSSR